jgi:hypothetical protein
MRADREEKGRRERKYLWWETNTTSNKKVGSNSFVHEREDRLSSLLSLRLRMGDREGMLFTTSWCCKECSSGVDCTAVAMGRNKGEINKDSFVNSYGLFYFCDDIDNSFLFM